MSKRKDAPDTVPCDDFASRSIYSKCADPEQRGYSGPHSEELFFLQTLIDSIPLPLFYKDAEGVYIGCNKAFESFLGIPRENIVGKSVYEVSPKELADRYREMDSALFSNPGTQIYRARVRYADGNIHDVVFYKATFPHANGRLGGLIGVILDVTEENRLKKALEERELFVRSTLDSLSANIAILDNDGSILYINKAWQAFAMSNGLADYNFIGINYLSICDAARGDYSDEAGLVAAGLRSILEGREREFSIEYPCHSPAERRWYRMIATRFEGPGPILAVIAHESITERKLAEEELSLRTKELERSNRELQDFAFVASHDLEEPLRKIRSFGMRLKSKCGEALGETGKDYLERMLGAGERMQSLLKALLEYSRITTRAEPFIPVDLSGLVREVVEDLEVRILETGGKVELGVLPTVEADSNQLRQLFQNLIGNALKYHGQESPVVSVYSEPDAAGNWRIFVRDNGIGFEEKYIERIFAPFQRLHGRGEFEGTGMGLAICKKIVERHGGTITARSTPSRGSTFVVTLSAKRHHGQSRA